MRPVVLTAVLTLGCAAASTGGGGAAPPGDQITLRTAGSASQMTLAEGGHVSGPRIQLTPSGAGYGGLFDSRLVDLRSNGQRIQGTVHDGLIDLHLSRTEQGLLARGMFGGRLGRLEASQGRITSSFGLCSYELEARGARFEGLRACQQRGRPPMPREVVVELPAAFQQLSPDRQIMLLALLLGD